MKPVALLIVMGALAASPVFAQSSPQSMPPAPPPPGIHDPGVKPTPVPKVPAKSLNEKIPALPASPSSAAPAATDARGEAPPQVTVRTEGTNTIQEYRQSGVLTMVVVTPKSGIPQTYLVDAQGKWQKSGPQSPVNPVMYKVLEWGKSPPATEDNSSNGGK